MAQKQQGGISLIVEGLQQFLSGLQQGNQAMQQFGQQAQQTAQATNTGFAQSAQAVSTFGQQVQMTGEVTNASLANMVNQLKYNVSDQAIEALTGLTSRAQDILQTVTQWKIPAPELDAAGWNRVAELMRDFTILDRKGFEADFKSVSATVVAEQQKMADGAKESAQEQERAMLRVTRAATQMGVALTAAGAAGTALLVSAGLQASRIEELSNLLEVTRSNAVQLARDENNLAKAEYLSSEAVQAQVQGIRDLHLSGVVANETVATLIRYNLDYTKAVELARLAQDAATFAMQDSSQAVEGLIHGITTLQPRILRTYGIMVNLTEAYRQFAAQNGLVATELTQAQRQQAAFNAVLAQAPRIAGAYEAAMDTASKQVRSLQTDVVDLKEAFGEELTPVLNTATGAFRGILHWLTELPDPLQAGLVGATGMGSALATLSGTALIAVPRIRKLAESLSDFSTFANVGGAALLGTGGLIAGVVGLGLALAAQEKARRDEATQLLEISGSYENYVRNLEAAGLEAYAFSEALFEVVKAKQEADQEFDVGRFAEARDELISMTGGLQSNITEWANLRDSQGEYNQQVSQQTIDALREAIGLLSDQALEVGLNEEELKKLADSFQLSADAGEELVIVLQDLIKYEQDWRLARAPIGEHEERMLGLIRPLVLYEDRMRETANWTEILAQREKARFDANVRQHEARTQFSEEVIDAFIDGERQVLDARLRRDRALEDLDTEYLQKSEDAWIDYQRALADSEGDLAKFHAGTLQGLLDLDLDYLQDREDAWTKYQQDLADAERDLQRDIEDANRDRAQAIADADRDYAQDRADALRDFNQDMEDDARDHAQKLLEIELDYQQGGLDLQEEYQQRLYDIQNLGQQKLLELQLDYEEKASDTRLKYLRQGLEEIEGGFYADSFKTTLRELFLGLREFGPGEIPNEFRDAYAQMLKDLEQLREDQKWEEEDLSDDITREYDGRLAELEQWLVDEQEALDRGYEERVAKEQERYAREQEERRRDYDQKLADLKIAHQRELEEIDLNNQRKLEDIRRDAERQRVELAQTYQRRLEDLEIEYNREKELIGQKLEEQNAEARQKYQEALEDLTRAKEREREEIDIQHSRRLEDIKADFDEVLRVSGEKWGLLPESLKAPYAQIKSDLKALLSTDPDSLENQWRDFVNNLWTIIQGGSPSRVMVDVGKSLISGLEKGLGGQNFNDMLTGDLDAQAFQANIQAALPANMATVPGGMGGSTRNFNNTSNLTVNANYSHQSEASLRDDLALYNSMMRAWGR